MAKKPDKLPQRFAELIEPILIQNEEIKCVFRESFKWETFFRKWLVITNFRLLICTRTLFGADSKEFHLREMDIERIRDNIGFYDSIVFKSKDKTLYRVAVFRTRRKEAESFLREVTKHIAERDLYLAFPSIGDDPSQSKYATSDKKRSATDWLSQGQTLTPEDLAKCAEELRHSGDLNQMGVITDKEYAQEKAKPCKKKKRV